MKKKLLTILCATLLFACNENRIFEDHTDPSGNLEWEKDQVVEFDVLIEDITSAYDLMACLRFAQGFAFTQLPVEISRTSPSGEVEKENYLFTPRNNDGTYNGDGAGDIWDLEQPYQSGIHFPEKGIYHYEFRQISPRPKIHMVMQVGLIVDKVVVNPQ